MSVFRKCAQFWAWLPPPSPFWQTREGASLLHWRFYCWLFAALCESRLVSPGRDNCQKERREIIAYSSVHFGLRVSLLARQTQVAGHTTEGSRLLCLLKVEQRIFITTGRFVVNSSDRQDQAFFDARSQVDRTLRQIGIGESRIGIDCRKYVQKQWISLYMRSQMGREVVTCDSCLLRCVANLLPTTEKDFHLHWNWKLSRFRIAVVEGNGSKMSVHKICGQLSGPATEP
jgi:hypothetical protein